MQSVYVETHDTPNLHCIWDKRLRFGKFIKSSWHKDEGDELSGQYVVSEVCENSNRNFDSLPRIYSTILWRGTSKVSDEEW